MKIADRLKCLTMLWFICRPFGFCQKVQFGVPEGEFWNNQVGEWHVDMSNWHVKLDDMFLVYYLMKWRFERNPEAIFSLPNLHKVMLGVKVEQNENGTFYKYQDNTSTLWTQKGEYLKKYYEVHQHDLGDTHRKILCFIWGKRSWGRQKCYRCRWWFNSSWRLLSVRFSKMDCSRRHGDNSWSNGCCAGETYWKLIKDFLSLYTDS